MFVFAAFNKKKKKSVDGKLGLDTYECCVVELQVPLHLEIKIKIKMRAPRSGNIGHKWEECSLE